MSKKSSENPRLTSGPSEEADGIESRELLAELSAFGLTANQGKVYLYLLGKSPMSANEISNGVGLHRVDVYRKLREMEPLGLVERHLDSPMKFKAITPELALDSLVGRIEQRASALQQASTELQTKLKAFQSRREGNFEPPRGIPEYRFRNAVPREQYIGENRQMIVASKREIMVVTSANGIRRGMIAGLFRDYGAAGHAGVRVRIIAEINRANLKQIKRYSRVIEIRHSTDVHFRLNIFDRAITVLSPQFTDTLAIKGEYDDYFVFKDPACAAAHSFLFDHVWDTCITLEERVRELNSSLSEKA